MTAAASAPPDLSNASRLGWRAAGATDERAADARFMPPPHHAVRATARTQTHEITAAPTRVSTLGREAAEKQGTVREIEARISKGANGGGQMRQELERLKLELADTKQK